MSKSFPVGFRIHVPEPVEEKMVTQDLAARDAISHLERFRGLLTYVVSEDTHYYLSGGITNEHWKPITGESVSAGVGLTKNSETGNIELGAHDGDQRTISLSGYNGFRFTTSSPQYFELSPNQVILSSVLGGLGIFNGLMQLSLNNGSSLELYDNGFQLNYRQGYLQGGQNYLQLYHSNFGGLYISNQIQVIGKDENGVDYYNTIASPDFLQVNHRNYLESHNNRVSQIAYLNPDLSKYVWLFKDEDEDKGAVFVDGVLNKGIEYGGDYENNFTEKSLITKGFVTPKHSEHFTVTFDGDYFSGIDDFSRSGNIYFDFSNARLGASTEMRHNDDFIPMFPENALLKFNTDDIVLGEDNYYLFVLVKATPGQEIVHVYLSREGGI